MDPKYRKEIEQLYIQMFDMLFEYARSFLPNDALAEEAVQDTFQIACQKPQAVCESANPKGWMVNAMKNVVSNTLRSRATANRILSEYVAAGLERLSENDAYAGIELFYGQIAESEEFKLIKELAVDGRSYLEMAQSRRISVQTCRKRVQRAKDVLRKKYEKDVTN